GSGRPRRPSASTSVTSCPSTRPASCCAARCARSCRRSSREPGSRPGARAGAAPSPGWGGVNVVLGAGAGMGAAVAAQLAERGPLLLADVDEARVARVAAELPGDHTTMRCDLADPDDVVRLVEAARP